MTDTDLVKALIKGDIEAFDALFARYSGKIFLLGKRYLGTREDAEGLVQEVFIKIWEKKEQIKEHLSFRAYLFTITYNTIRRYFRVKYRKPELLQEIPEELAAKAEQVATHVEFLELVEEVERAIESLSPRQRQIYKMSRQDGLSHKEIARLLSLRPKTVENHIHEAIRKIREHLSRMDLLAIIFITLFL